MSLEVLTVIQTSFFGILLASWEVFVEAAPYLIFGLAISGLLNILVPDQKIVDYLGASAGKVRSVINAALAGLPLPLCSCGVVPAAISIRKRGANRGATLSFLISTPETGIDSIAITYALLDPLMAIFRPLATIFTAILAGIMNNFLIEEEPEKEELKKQENPVNKVGVLAVSTLIGASVKGNECRSSSCSCTRTVNSEEIKVEPANIVVKTIDVKPAGLELRENSNKSFEGASTFPLASSVPLSSVSQKNVPSCDCGSCGCEDKESETGEKNKKSLREQLIKGMRYAYIELLGDIAKWMLIGILLAGVISYAIPESFIQNYLGGGLSSMFVMLLIGIPLYICASASTPLAASLIAKGMSPGTAFVFLLAGPATNAATITMVTRFLGKRSAALYVGMISLCALASGILLDWIYLRIGISASTTLGIAKELLPEDLKVILAILLLPLMLYGIFRRGKECGCPDCH